MALTPAAVSLGGAGKAQDDANLVLQRVQSVVQSVGSLEQLSGKSVARVGGGSQTARFRSMQRNTHKPLVLTEASLAEARAQASGGSREACQELCTHTMYGFNVQQFYSTSIIVLVPIENSHFTGCVCVCMRVYIGTRRLSNGLIIKHRYLPQIVFHLWIASCQ